jgi:cellulose synthase/poly-beta-1,6-N-acetylglucosamine synthase-like glycosyltransferase
MPSTPETKPARPLSLLSVVIPARDEEGCIASTLEHLHLELSLRSVPHEIVVVDDGSTDSTWQILQGEAAKIPTLRPVQNPGPHGFGRAIIQFPLFTFIFFSFQVSNFRSQTPLFPFPLQVLSSFLDNLPLV